MNTPLTLSLLLATAALGARPAQEALTPVDSSLSQQGLPGARSYDMGALAESLRSDDLAERHRAYEEALGAARDEPGVREVVEGWSRDTNRLELAWTAQLMLRELDTVPRRRARGVDRFPFGGPQALPGLDEDLFGPSWMDDLFGDLERLMGPGHGGLVPIPNQGLAPGSGSRSEGFQLQLGPDGVRVEVREEVDGEEQTKTYEAESLEALLETYPELKDRVSSGRGFGFALPGQRLPGRGLLRGLEDLPMRTDRLGVQVREPGAFRRTVPGLAEDTGLEVVGVLPGSLGEALGLTDGDVVVLLNGRTIRGVADVKSALAERLEGEGVEVEVIGRDEKTRTLRWAPPAKSSGPQPLRPL
jgi:hypothetical protein